MAKITRQLRADFWEEDWFLEMPETYKILYMYLRFKCDHAGIWRVHKTLFRQVISNKIVMYDDFLLAVNKDEISGEPAKRVIALDKNRWLIPQHIIDNCGSKYSNESNFHVSMLKILLANNVDLSLIPMDFSNYYKIVKRQKPDFQEDTIEGLGKGTSTDGEGLGKGTSTVGHPIVNLPSPESRVQSQESVFEKGLLGEKQKPAEIPQNGQLNGAHVNGMNGVEQIFKLQSVYEKSPEEYNEMFPHNKLPKEDFLQWKSFVDFVRDKKFEDLFKADFIKPKDWPEMVQKGFTPEMWLPVTSRICGTGVEAKHNLFHRIPQFLESVQKEAKRSKKSKTNTDISDIDYNELKK